MKQEAEPTLSLRERQGQARQQAIIQAAQELIATEGYEAMTMDDLAAHAGISKPTLYQYFGSKEAVARGACIAMLQQGIQQIDSLSPELPIKERLAQTIRLLITEKFIRRRSHFGTNHLNLITTIRQHPDFVQLRNSMLNRLTAMVGEGQAQGVFNPDLMASVVAQTILSVLRDTEHIERIDRGEVDGKQLVETLVNMLINGILPPGCDQKS